MEDTSTEPVARRSPDRLAPVVESGPYARRPRPPPPHAPSSHQARVFAFVREGRGHAVVQATAGSGKTTTLVQVAGMLPREHRACFLAFNRSTAAELRQRLPAHVEATTVHALGRRILLDTRPRLGKTLPRRPGEPDEGKYRQLAAELVRRRGDDLGVARESTDAVARYLARLAHFARLDLTPPRSPTAVARLVRRYGLEPVVVGRQRQQVHALLPDLLRAGAEAGTAGLVDFTDMLYLPHVLDLPGPRYDVVCVDEAQDLSRAALALVMRLLSPGARGIFVGDARQAIYGFAGADERSLQRIAHRTSTISLPLSRSFRCPQRHVTLARRFSPEMEAAPGAALGTLRTIAEARLHRHVRPGDLVLSRTNAPLVNACLRLARAGVPARVLGLELVASVRALADRLLPPDDLRFARPMVRTAAREEARRIEVRLLTSPAMAASLRDAADDHEALDILLAALESRHLRPTRRQFDQLVTELFGGTSGVLLSTIHKAKGREAERVFLLRPEELALHGAATLDSQPRSHDPDAGADATSASGSSERNVLFVALTRARAELVLVERQPGAIERRLRLAAAAPQQGADSVLDPLVRDWNAVLRMAAVMARART